MSDLADNRIQQIIDIHGGSFTPEEFGPKRAHMNPEMVEHDVRFRNSHGYPTLLTSTYRPEGPHKIGATDKVLYKDWKKRQPEPMELWRLATTWPFWGVGIYFDWVVDEGKPTEHQVVGLHNDIVEPGKRDRPLRWLRTFGRYFYQSTANGKFYEKSSGDETTLEEEIDNWKQRNQQPMDNEFR